MLPLAKFNFFIQEFGAKVTCSKPSVDGYELCNLFTNINQSVGNVVLQPKGFLVESFIKPPINIVIELPFLVNLDRVMVNGKIGQQRSTGLELLTFSQDPNQVKDIDSSIFTQVGRGNSSVLSVFCFVNRRFQASNLYSNTEPMKSAFESLDNKEIVTVEVRHRNHKLSFVSHLMLRITSVSGGSTCAVRALEVWGEPSNWASEKTVATFMKCFNSVTNSQNSASKTTSISEESLSDSCNNESSNSGSIHSNKDREVIPQEFLDPLTQEILVLPMLLPSGHVIDQSTLEKHSASEAQWGRSPSDPFTGITFTKGSTPVVHSTLKVRIDRFLLSHPELDVHSRTIGHVSLESAGKVMASALVDNKTDSCPRKRETVSNSCGYAGWLQEKPKNTDIVSPSTSRISVFKRSLSPGRDCTNRDHCVHKKQRLYNVNEKLITVSSDSAVHSNDKPVGKQTNNSRVNDKDALVSNVSQRDDAGKVTSSANQRDSVHSSRLSSSLDFALSRTLASLPSFTLKNSDLEDNKSVDDSANVSRDCLFCSKVTLGNMYRLCCLDLICRDCLVKADSSNILCHRHKVTTSRRDIIKVHLS